MRANELKKYERLLIERRSQLSGTMTSMAGEALKPNGAGQDVDEIADVGSDQFEQELTLGLMEAERVELRYIDAALDRIADGTFGTCESCETKISKPRLDAIPSCRYCIECQSKLERFGEL